MIDRCTRPRPYPRSRPRSLTLRLACEIGRPTQLVAAGPLRAIARQMPATACRP
ncbi:hypothetical protein [Brevibacillus laterosporus]|uniref:hypothetical protein n=1 Tax=Brevibacillus laterosporus TaxID=1465 RepID=UPI003D190A69